MFVNRIKSLRLWGIIHFLAGIILTYLAWVGEGVAKAWLIPASFFYIFSLVCFTHKLVYIPQKTYLKLYNEFGMFSRFIGNGNTLVRATQKVDLTATPLESNVVEVRLDEVTAMRDSKGYHMAAPVTIFCYPDWSRMPFSKQRELQHQMNNVAHMNNFITTYVRRTLQQKALFTIAQKQMNAAEAFAMLEQVIAEIFYFEQQASWRDLFTWFDMPTETVRNPYGLVLIEYEGVPDFGSKKKPDPLDMLEGLSLKAAQNDTAATQPIAQSQAHSTVAATMSPQPHRQPSPSWISGLLKGLTRLFDWFSMKDAPSPTSTMPPMPTEENVIFVVIEAGDTLRSLAERYRTTVEELKRLNNIRDHEPLATGNYLRAPSPPNPRMERAVTRLTGDLYATDDDKKDDNAGRGSAGSLYD